MPKFTVTIGHDRREYGTATVEAVDEDAAQEKMRDLMMAGSDEIEWELGDVSEDYDFVCTEEVNDET